MSRINNTQRKLSAESLESRDLMAIYVMIPTIDGDVATQSYDQQDHFVADSFSFAVEREMKESGEKGGTEDINIGVGELQECTVSKSMDAASAQLAQYAINGNSCGTAEIDFVEVAEGDNGTTVYLNYKLERTFVKSWSTSGDADDRPTEEVASYYNKIAFEYLQTADGDVELLSAELVAENGDTLDINIGIGEAPHDSPIVVDAAIAELLNDDSLYETNDGNWFIADSFSFGVEREMKESGEKDGTEDLDIGNVELQECTVSDSTDASQADSLRG